MRHYNISGRPRDAAISAGVINSYFHTFFPRAARLGAQLRAKGEEPLAWMTQSWLVDLFLDCPAGLDLECPTSNAVATFKAAVRAGDITWHAFPHNAQLSLASPELVKELVSHTHRLDDRLQSPYGARRTLSQRDVVGLPRPLIPALLASNVTAISVGSNGRCLPPNVPLAYRWRDTYAADQRLMDRAPPPTRPRVSVPSGAEILVLNHPYGYGEAEVEAKARNWLQLPGHDEALLYGWQGDNEGPPADMRTLDQIMAFARAAFPDAETVVRSTLDDFVAGVPPHVVSSLPLIEGDLEDTWIQGAAQAPTVMRYHKAIQRGFDSCVADGACIPDGSADVQRNVTRLLSKNVEHTFGLSVSNYGMLQRRHYSNAEFHRARAQNDSTFELFATSWVENWRFGRDAPLAALAAEPTSPLKPFIDAEVDAVRPAAVPSPLNEGFHLMTDPTAVLRGLGGWLDIGLDGTSGAIVHLHDQGAGSEWADTDHPLALLRYQTLLDEDFWQFRAAYLKDGYNGSGANEYGRPNVTRASGGRSATVSPERVLGVYTKSDAVLVEVAFAAELSQLYGAPDSAWLRFSVSPAHKVRMVSIEATLVAKTATRFPDAMYLSFYPTTGGATDTGWWMDKMGEWVSPLEAVDGASKPIHGVLSGVAYSRGRQDGVFIHTPDTSLVNFNSGDGTAATRGEPRPFPMPLIGPLNVSNGVSLPLYANGYWYTNYPAFIPFDGNKVHDDYVWRAALEFY